MFTEQTARHSADGLRIGLVVSRYHEEITAAMVAGAQAVFREAGGDESGLTILIAPGTFEIPVLADTVARDTYDAVVAIGCVITGETTHDRYIADSVAHALQLVSIDTGVPIAFGVLTCQTIEQARARAGGDKGNKGAEAMRAAIDAAGELHRFYRIPPHEDGDAT